MSVRQLPSENGIAMCESQGVKCFRVIDAARTVFPDDPKYKDNGLAAEASSYYRAMEGVTGTRLGAGLKVQGVYLPEKHLEPMLKLLTNPQDHAEIRSSFFAKIAVNKARRAAQKEAAAVVTPLYTNQPSVQVTGTTDVAPHIGFMVPDSSISLYAIMYQGAFWIRLNSFYATMRPELKHHKNGLRALGRNTKIKTISARNDHMKGPPPAFFQHDDIREAASSFGLSEHLNNRRREAIYDHVNRVLDTWYLALEAEPAAPAAEVVEDPAETQPLQAVETITEEDERALASLNDVEPEANDNLPAIEHERRSRLSASELFCRVENIDANIHTLRQRVEQMSVENRDLRMERDAAIKTVAMVAEILKANNALMTSVRQQLGAR